MRHFSLNPFYWMGYGIAALIQLLFRLAKELATKVAEEVNAESTTPDAYVEPHVVGFMLKQESFNPYASAEYLTPWFHPQHQDAVNAFIKELNDRYSQEDLSVPFKIKEWYPIRYQDDWNVERIVVRDEYNIFRAGTLKYTNDTKDGSPKVVKMNLYGGVIRGIAAPKLAFEKIVISIAEVLKKAQYIPYIETVIATINSEGEAVFNAKILLGLTDEEWNERYGTERHCKAWCEALAGRFGGGLETPPVTAGEKAGTFMIKKAVTIEE